MPEETAGSASTATDTSDKAVPWSLIEGFAPQVDDPEKWAIRFQRLAAVWPPQHLGQLAIRTALQCKGSAVDRLSLVPTED